MPRPTMIAFLGFAFVGGCGSADVSPPSGEGGSHGTAGDGASGGVGGDVGSAGSQSSNAGGGSATAGSNGGTSGSNSGGGAPDASVNPGISDAGPSVRDVYIADRAPNAPGILIHVENNCPFDLWIHGAGNGGVLQPDNAQIKVHEALDYTAPDQWSAARVTASSAATPGNELDKVEMTLTNKVINFNITYVDWVGLPVEMVPIGSGADCKRVGCYVPEPQILTGCPDGLLSGKKCLSAGSYCRNAANQAKPYCHALDAKIAACAAGGKYAGCGNGTTPEVYGCSAFFGGSPKWCAALNRGMIDDPDNGNIALYYQTAPYNTYSKWVHSVCPGIYAFPYDDYGKTNESGFHACSGGRQLNITFCPAG